MQASDDLFLRIAVALAKRGQMTCAPNPPVGCVIVRDGQITTIDLPRIVERQNALAQRLANL